MLIISGFQVQYGQYFSIFYILPTCLKLQHTMRNEGNNDDILRGKSAITTLLLTFKIYIVCRFIIHRGKQKNRKNIFLQLMIFINYLL